MALNIVDAKTIDELQELGKLSGTEKTIISDGYTTKKLSIDTILGYIASRLHGTPVAAVISDNTSITSSASGDITFIPEGEEIPVYKRVPGCFYLEEQRQSSIRTEINLPASITVSGNLGLKRV